MVGPALLLAACAAAWSCARPSQPPGAPEEAEPPGVRSVFPARDTVIPELSDRAKIQFDEPIQAGSGLQRQMVASPAYPYSVSTGHSEISVRPEGGWRPGAVYVLELPAGISDLLNNVRREPTRMVFSTGPPVVPTLLRARLFDRLTGEEQTDGRILYLAARDDTASGGRGGVASVGDSLASARDTVPYSAVADSGGVYVLRHVPPGDYWAYGFVDRNRNRRLDRWLEPYDSARVTLGSDSAEASVELFALERDSTPPRLGVIETPDSTTVRLGFDDHLRPGRQPGGLLVRRRGTGDSVPILDARALTAEDTTPADTTPADTAAADSVVGDRAAPDTAPVPDSAAAAAGDTGTAVDSAAPEPGPSDSIVADPGAVDSTLRGVAAGDSGAATAADDTAAERPPRPTRILRVRLGEALTAGDTFRVRVRGVVNMWGFTTDADTTFVYTPPPDSARADSLGAGSAADSAAADTARGGT